MPEGKTVACALPRTAIGAAVYFGCLMSNRLCFVLDAAHPPERNAGIASDPIVGAIVAGDEMAIPTPKPVLRMSDILASDGNGWRVAPTWDADAPAAIHFTSGSSGTPKGIVLSERSIAARIAQSLAIPGLSPDDCLVVPSFPAASGTATTLGAVLAGVRVAVTDIPRYGVRATLRPD